MPLSERTNVPEYQALAPACQWSHLWTVPSHLGNICDHRSAEGRASACCQGPKGSRQGGGGSEVITSASLEQPPEGQSPRKAGGGTEKPGPSLFLFDESLSVRANSPQDVCHPLPFLLWAPKVQQRLGRHGPVVEFIS